MSRRPIQLVIVAVALTTGVVTWSRVSEPAPIPPPPPAPHSGVSCFRQGGDPGYCRCLDRMESARDEAGHGAGLPPMDHPTIRYALRHPQQYPIINADTLRCLAPPAPRAPGVVATVARDRA